MSSPEIVAYFTQWSLTANGYSVKDIVTTGAAVRITCINYAFGHVRDGRCLMLTEPDVMDAYSDYIRPFTAAESVDDVADVADQPLRGHFNQLRKLKARFPHIRVLISLGGWLWSEGLSDAALTEESRRKAVASCINVYLRGNLPEADGAGGPAAAAGVFDGIDVDWEYPAVLGHAHNVYRPEDTRNFALLLAEFRRQLDELGAQTGRRYLLTVATAAPAKIVAQTGLGEIHRHLDWINVMSYDLHGAWERVTNFNAPLYGSPDAPAGSPTDTVDSAVRFHLGASVPREKLIVGVPFYGRGWAGVASTNDGLYQLATGPAAGSYEAGFENYRVLAALGWPPHRDPHTRGAWLFRDGVFWAYDDPAVIAEKARYIRSLGLRGAMIWSLDGDDAAGALLAALHAELRDAG